jgi:hypothetical protein
MQVHHRIHLLRSPEIFGTQCSSAARYFVKKISKNFCGRFRRLVSAFSGSCLLAGPNRDVTKYSAGHSATAQRVPWLRQGCHERKRAGERWAACLECKHAKNALKGNPRSRCCSYPDFGCTERSGATERPKRSGRPAERAKCSPKGEF